MDPIAVRVLRGESTESVHRASVAVCDPQGRLVASFGNPRLGLYTRSTVKPVQALDLILTGAADRFGLEGAELAVIASSHSGESVHVRTVQGILEKIGRSEADLQCGPHPPYDRREAERLGTAYTSIHNNCSGKHAGMLAVCVHKGWDVATYLDPDHPFQKSVRAHLATLSSVPAEDLPLGIDGCGAPTFYLPLRSLARIYGRLARPESVRGEPGRALRRIRDAMLEHPDLVGGTDALDTEFIRAFAGRLLVKAGSEASRGMALLGPGLGAAVKIEDGGSRAVGLVLMRVLEELGVASEREKGLLQRHWNEPIRNHAGRIVGRMECDVRLRRRASAAGRRPVLA